MIQVLLKDSPQFTNISPEQAEAEFGVEWISSLLYKTQKIFFRIPRRSARAMRKRELSRKETWLGVRFSKEILEGSHPTISIRYIDEVFGYGAYAEETIKAGAYVGEYIGVIRRRRLWFDRKNDYLFEYTIGDWARNPYVIDAKEKGNFTRFINHSEDPNLETLSVYAGEVMHIIFLAKKKIEKGEQLSYHYGDYFWRKRRKDVKPLR